MTGNRFRVAVDEDRCVGSGDCALVAPPAFEVDEDSGIARVLPALPTPSGLGWNGPLSVAPPAQSG